MLAKYTYIELNDRLVEEALLELSYDGFSFGPLQPGPSSVRLI